MLDRITRSFWLLLAKLSRDRVATWFAKRMRTKLEDFAAKFRESAKGAAQASLSEAQRRKLADKMIRLLLYAMSVITLIEPGFQQANLIGFRAKLVFKTRSTRDPVACSAIFDGTLMQERKGAVPSPDATVIFKDGLSLFDYVLFSDDHDVVNLLLENKVEIDGNLSMVYKFMYMVRSLIRPLGLT